MFDSKYYFDLWHSPITYQGKTWDNSKICCSRLGLSTLQCTGLWTCPLVGLACWRDAWTFNLFACIVSDFCFCVLKRSLDSGCTPYISITGSLCDAQMSYFRHIFAMSVVYFSLDITSTATLSCFPLSLFTHCSREHQNACDKRIKKLHMLDAMIIMSQCL